MRKIPAIKKVVIKEVRTKYQISISEDDIRKAFGIPKQAVVTMTAPYQLYGGESLELKDCPHITADWEVTQREFTEDAQKECEHQWEEQPGEPPKDVCTSCGEVRE